MKAPALFVDGVGRVREQDVPLGTLTVVERTPTGPLSFTLLGELPDGKRVYGYPFEQRPFFIWKTVVLYPPEMPPAAMAKLRQQRIDQIRGDGPVRVLHDTGMEPGTNRRSIAGVARRPLNA